MMEALTTTFEKLGIPANHEGIIQLSGSRRLTILNNPGVDRYHQVAIQICPNPTPETPEKESWWDLVTLQVFLDGETVILELPGFKEEKNGIIQRKRYLLETGEAVSAKEAPLVKSSEREGLIFFLENNGMSEAGSLPDQIEPEELLKAANTLIDLARCRDENGNPIEEKVIGLINLKQADLLPTLQSQT